MRWAVLGVTALALAGCTGAEEGVDLGGGGRLAFQQDCAACHGPDGRGGGPLAAELSVAPPNLTQLSARNGGVFPRDEVLSVIDGYRGSGSHQRVMPEFGAGDLGPLVTTEGPDGLGTPIPLRLLELALYLERIQEP
jgi:Cytochrome c, mono- and diheme variants